MKIFIMTHQTTKHFFIGADDAPRKKYFVNVKHTNTNIDSLNPLFSELTGQYYLWKNPDVGREEVLGRIVDNVGPDGEPGGLPEGLQHAERELRLVEIG